ncbi:MAG: hypothetical protein ACR2OU_15500 [Thermomicrobiales bacterium]
MNGTLPDSMELAAGVPLVVVIPALVEVAKRQGLPDRFAGLAAIVIGTSLLVLGDLALGGPSDERLAVRIATWLLGGILYGLAASGLYSQRDVFLARRDGESQAM